MTQEEFRERMQGIYDETYREGHQADWEDRHKKGDALLMEALRELGYSEGVDIYDSWGKWYA